MRESSLLKSVLAKVLSTAARLPGFLPGGRYVGSVQGTPPMEAFVLAKNLPTRLRPPHLTGRQLDRSVV